MTMTVAVTERSTPFDPLAALASPEKNLVRRLGILCMEIDRQVVKLMPELRRQYGLIVAAKSPEGQAQFIDVEPGDVIHAINNLPVVSLDAFRKLLTSCAPGTPLCCKSNAMAIFNMSLSKLNKRVKRILPLLPKPATAIRLKLLEKHVSPARQAISHVPLEKTDMAGDKSDGRGLIAAAERTNLGDSRPPRRQPSPALSSAFDRWLTSYVEKLRTVGRYTT